ncbi:PREDICTED: GPI ethanolamine phosphate transferase 2 isoform X2 [Nanorana parkeri]|uniref:GPI ethanolamine phosphate transferase 2 isoform X2 n=1 Tax=Nanorana parkeri TaxID=125878 RepID=UPI000854151E|nr:PREDICTED: GPI ethanolamine phosphate transferase 2 isoform X2 [Nanorana parkeri]
MKVGSSVLACCCLLVQVVGLVLFLRGFFPVPVRSQSRRNSASDVPAEPSAAGLSSNWTQPPHPLFKRVVILLIDGLRQDFIFGIKGKEHMPYITQLIQKGTTHSFIARASAPTVTMPRIKALMTGTIPGFIDIVMNLNTQELQEDNLIWQAKQAGKRIFFYGDDTWIKLFPKHFVEYDGTTSFFVSDFTEVDNNVTRHLDDVLKRNDWDMLVLHYLGLDHIGHLTGPHSHLIGPKLYEMDLVLKRIHSALLLKDEDSAPNVIVVCGDHGMSEVGSHGGSSEEEIQTPLVLISSAFQNKAGISMLPEIQQTDLAPTLALGLGLPISRSSLGTFITAVVDHKTMREQLRFLHLNGHQLCMLLKENMEAYEKDEGLELFKKAEKYHGNWIKLYLEGNTSEVLINLGRKVLKQYLEALKKLSSTLSKQVAEYDIYSMTVGAIITLEILCLLLLSVPNALGNKAEFDLPLATPLFSLFFYLTCLVLAAVHVIVCTSSENTCFFCSMSWLLAMGIMGLISALLCIILSILGKMLLQLKPSNEVMNSSIQPWSELDILLLVGTLGHVISMGSSSFIEEEHQTWYFLVSTMCLALSQEMCRKYFLVKKGNLPGSAAFNQVVEEEAHNEIYDSHKKEFHDVKLPIITRFIKNNEKWIALSSPGLILICCRLLRPLNQTGVQWIHRPDFGHWLTSSEHKAELSFLVAVCLIMIFILIQGKCSLVSKVALMFGLLGVYSYRAAVGHVLYPWQQNTKEITKGITEARFVYIFVLGILITGIKDLLTSHVLNTDSKAKAVGLWEIYSGLILLAAILFRPHNLVVLVFCLLIQLILTMFIWKILKYDAAEITIMHYWFGQAFFFFQGNSNTISTVDISAGFVGLDNYIEYPAIFLTVFVTYSGPLLWTMHMLYYLSAETNWNSTAVAHGCYCYAIIRSLPVTVYILLVTALRYHLFIWSVFSPKLLYEVIHLSISAVVCAVFIAVDKNQVNKSEG